MYVKKKIFLSNIKGRLGQKSFGFKKKQRFYAVAFCMVAIDLVK